MDRVVRSILVDLVVDVWRGSPPNPVVSNRRADAVIWSMSTLYQYVYGKSRVIVNTKTESELTGNHVGQLVLENIIPEPPTTGVHDDYHWKTKAISPVALLFSQGLAIHYPPAHSEQITSGISITATQSRAHVIIDFYRLSLIHI